MACAGLQLDASGTVSKWHRFLSFRRKSPEDQLKATKPAATAAAAVADDGEAAVKASHPQLSLLLRLLESCR